jgi:hypothetical protein
MPSDNLANQSMSRGPIGDHHQAQVHVEARFRLTRRASKVRRQEHAADHCAAVRISQLLHDDVYEVTAWPSHLLWP